MVDTTISIRTARDGDEVSIAEVHDLAWRDAYQGVIPGRELERMIARRGPLWWRNAIARGSRLLVLDFGEKIAGYVSYGRNRVPALTYSGHVFQPFYYQRKLLILRSVLGGESCGPRIRVHPRDPRLPER